MPDPKSRRKRRWLRRLLILAAGSLCLAIAGGVLALSHLEWIAKWSIHYAFPGVTAEMEALSLKFPSQLVVKNLELHSSASGDSLLRMKGGTATFRFADIWHARVEAIDLDAPDLVVSPELGDALGMKSSSSAAKRSGGRSFSWSISRLRLANGRVRIRQFVQRAPEVEMNIDADFRDLGVGESLGSAVHEIRLADATAKTPDGAKALFVDNIVLRFTTDGIFSKSRIESVAVEKGRAEISPDTFDAFQNSASLAAKPAGNAGSADPGTSRWTIGAVDVGKLGVRIPDAPGSAGRVEFDVEANLRDIGAPGTSAGQSVQSVSLAAIRVDSEDSKPIFRADAAGAKFTIEGLVSHRIAELTLKNPGLEVGIAGASASANAAGPPSTSSPEGQPFEWLIEKLSCPYGSLLVKGLHDGEGQVSAKFTIQASDFGTAGSAADLLQQLTIWDVAVDRGNSDPILSLDLARVGFRPGDLISKHRVASVDIQGGRLRVGEDLQSFFARETSDAQSAAPTNSESKGWSIGSLKIAGVRTRIEDDRPGITELHFTLNTELRDVSTNGLSDQIFDQAQIVELADIVLRSPIDRANRVLSLRSVFVRFTLRDLTKKHLREVVILRPTIYLNRDLFVYMERATASDGESGQAPTPDADDAPQWSIEHLEVKFGKLVLGSGGTSDVGLPLEFETVIDNISLDNLANLQMQAVLKVPRQSYDFDDYQLAIEDVQGDLRFSYPPEKGEKNLVQKLAIAGIRWRQFLAKDAWIAATFDARGINGQFGGAAYDGYIGGGFSFFFSQDSPWIGWVTGTTVDTKALTDVISPQNFQMTGPLDFEVQVDAFRKDIDRLLGRFHVAEPGRLKIGKLDDLISRIPGTWPTIKQDTTRIALETLRDFDYTKAEGDFWFVESQGILNLGLSGPSGSRDFEIILHDGHETENPWQQGKLGNQ